MPTVADLVRCAAFPLPETYAPPPLMLMDYTQDPPVEVDIAEMPSEVEVAAARLAAEMSGHPFTDDEACIALLEDEDHPDWAPYKEAESDSIPHENGVDVVNIKHGPMQELRMKPINGKAIRLIAEKDGEVAQSVATTALVCGITYESMLMLHIGDYGEVAALAVPFIQASRTTNG